MSARALDGQATQATQAALVAVAGAFRVRRSAVTVVRGRTSRDKLVEIDGDPVALQTRLAELISS